MSMVRYGEELIEEIISANDIVDVISQYVTLKRSGRNFFGLCPFHREKSPSFSVSPDKQIFHCFGCGVGGNVIHFISKIENLDFKETLEFLADRAGILLPTYSNTQDNKKQEIKEKVYKINELTAHFFHENLYKLTSKQAQEYVKQRKLDNKTLKTFLIGYSNPDYTDLYYYLKENGFSDEEMLATGLVNKTETGKFINRFRNRLMIPIRDIKGKVIAFGGRVLDDSKPKYINSPENIIYTKGKNLFGLDVAKKNDLSKIIIVEGYMDVISLFQRGITNVVASLGTALTENQGRLLRKYAKQVILGYDSDGAGQAAIVRGLDILTAMGCDVRILQMEGAKDPDEYVIKYGSGRFLQLVDNAISLVEYKVKILKQNSNINSTNDKIKFLNEIAKILLLINNKIEQEVYIDKISTEYNISKEAIYAQINKLKYGQNSGEKILQKSVIRQKETSSNTTFSESTQKENAVIALLISLGTTVYNKTKDIIKPSDLKLEVNSKILERLYKEFDKGIEKVENVLDLFKNEQDCINQLTGIMAKDYETSDIDKIINIYKKDQLIEKKNGIIKKLEDKTMEQDEIKQLEKELTEVIIKLSKLR